MTSIPNQIERIVSHLRISRADWVVPIAGLQALQALQTGEACDHVWGGWGDPTDPRDQAAHIVAGWAQAGRADLARAARIVEAIERLYQEVEDVTRQKGAFYALAQARLCIERPERPGCSGCNPERHPDAFEPIRLVCAPAPGRWLSPDESHPDTYRAQARNGQEMLELLTNRCRQVRRWTGYFGTIGHRSVWCDPTPAAREAIDLARRRMLGRDPWVEPVHPWMSPQPRAAVAP